MTVKEYISKLDEPRKEEIQKIHDFIVKQVPDAKPFMYNDQIIGYGKFPYKTKSGCEGDWMRVGLSSRKSYISLYVCGDENNYYLAQDYVGKLKANIGKGCIRFKKFEDIDFDVLADLLKKV